MEGGGGAAETSPHQTAQNNHPHEQLPQYRGGRPGHLQLSQGEGMEREMEVILISGQRVSFLPDLIQNYQQADLLQLRHQGRAGAAVSEPQQEA